MRQPRRAPSRAGRTDRVLVYVIVGLLAVAGIGLLFSFRGARQDGFASRLHRQAGVRPLPPVPGAPILPVSISSESRQRQSAGRSDAASILADTPRDDASTAAPARLPPRLTHVLHDVWAAPIDSSQSEELRRSEAPGLSRVTEDVSSLTGTTAGLLGDAPVQAVPAPSPKPSDAAGLPATSPSSDLPSVYASSLHVETGQLDAATAKLSEILSHRHLRPFRKDPRATSGNHMSDSEPDMVLLDPGEDADAGLAFAAPLTGVVPADAATAGARRAHEQGASLAIVVVTSPRILAESRDRALPHYFRFSGTCGGDGVYAPSE